jgi:O-antigen ligase
MKKAPPAWLQHGYCALFACLPWSVDTRFDGWNMSLPSEPLIGILALAWCPVIRPAAIKTVWRRNSTLCITAGIISWMAIAAFFSAQPLVSWKYWLVEAAHIWVFFAGVAIWPALWQRALPWYLASLSALTIYTLAQHAGYDFRADQAMLSARPFFQNHTLWAAALSLAFLFAWKPARGARSFPPAFFRWFPIGRRTAKNIVTGCLLTALCFSCCRAAWISTALAAGIWAFFALEQRYRPWLYGLALTGSILLGIKIHAWSSTDVSLRERINRWHCALEMARTAPLTGFGPGTFAFQYPAFQDPANLTRISMSVPPHTQDVNTYGRGGGAHSEYARALAETGWPGLFLLIWLAGRVLWKNRPRNWQEAGVWLGLSAFFMHGLANDFLHDGKIAALVWGGIAWWTSTNNHTTATPA